MHSVPCIYPLDWPANKPRTPSWDQKAGRFLKKNNSHYNRGITLRESIARVSSELRAFGTIDLDDCGLRTMLQTRNDGQFRANQGNPADVGAVLMFRHQGRESIIAIDVYTKVEQNIAAIASSLSSLRTLERHDSTILDAALSGFHALPSPIATPHWRAVLAVPDGEVTLEQVKRQYRVMMSRAHPDKGGHQNTAAAVSRAYDDAKAELRTGQE